MGGEVLSADARRGRDGAPGRELGKGGHESRLRGAGFGYAVTMAVFGSVTSFGLGPPGYLPIYLSIF